MSNLFFLLGKKRCSILTLILLVLEEGWVEGQVGDTSVELGGGPGAHRHRHSVVHSQASSCTQQQL